MKIASDFAVRMCFVICAILVVAAILLLFGALLLWNRHLLFGAAMCVLVAVIHWIFAFIVISIDENSD